MMKNTLLTTTALALTGFAGTASAVEVAAGAVNLDIGGYFTTHIAASSVKTGTTGAKADYDGFDVHTTSEIHFKPSITLDNGIKVGAHIELEGDTAGDQIDESYITISGDFGQVLLGSENSAGYKMTVAAPSVSFIGVNSSSLTAFIPYSSPTAGADIFRGTLGSTYIENDRNNDANRLTYFSPRFGGLQLGASYAHDEGEGNGPVDRNKKLTDIIDIAANYGGSFGGVDVNASARYGTASAPGKGTDPEIWGAGLKFGFSGFTIGGSFAEQDGTKNRDGSSFDVGIGYSNGPWSYSLTYFEGNNVDNEGILDVARIKAVAPKEAVPSRIATEIVPAVEAVTAVGDTQGVAAVEGVAVGDLIPGKPAVKEVKAFAGSLGDPTATEELKTIVLAVKYTVSSNFSVGAFIADSSFSESVGPADDVDGTVVGIGASFSF